MIPRELLDPKIEFKPSYKNIGKIAAGMAGTGNACLLKQSGANYREIGKVPKSELSSVLRNLQQGAAHALILDSSIDQATINLAGSKGIKCILGHSKPFKIKRTPGLTVLCIRDIVSRATATIPPAPKPIIRKVATKKVVKK
jgi:hypothetical protein